MYFKSSCILFIDFYPSWYDVDCLIKNCLTRGISLIREKTTRKSFNQGCYKVVKNSKKFKWVINKLLYI